MDKLILSELTNGLNTVWMLLAAMLVFFMQPGFAPVSYTHLMKQPRFAFSRRCIASSSLRYVARMANQTSVSLSISILVNFT